MRPTSARDCKIFHFLRIRYCNHFNSSRVLLRFVSLFVVRYHNVDSGATVSEALLCWLNSLKLRSQLWISHFLIAIADCLALGYSAAQNNSFVDFGVHLNAPVRMITPNRIIVPWLFASIVSDDKESHRRPTESIKINSAEQSFHSWYNLPNNNYNSDSFGCAQCNWLPIDFAERQRMWKTNYFSSRWLSFDCIVHCILMNSIRTFAIQSIVGWFELSWCRSHGVNVRLDSEMRRIDLDRGAYGQGIGMGESSAEFPEIHMNSIIWTWKCGAKMYVQMILMLMSHKLVKKRHSLIS